MRPSNVHLSTLTTVEECDSTIYQIERNHKNYGVTLSEWRGGSVDCYLSKAAKLKIRQIEKRANTLAIKQKQENF